MNTRLVLKYFSILILFAICSCSPRIEYTGVGRNIFGGLKDALFIEAKLDASIINLEDRSLMVGETLSLELVDESRNSMERVKWSLRGGVGSLSVSAGDKTAIYAPDAIGNVKIYAEYDNIVKVVEVKIEGHAPVIDSISDQLNVNAGNSISTINAGISGGDIDKDGQLISYQCFYDNILDSFVDNANACSSLSGLTFNNSSGVLTWTTLVSQVGSYEFVIVSRDGDTSSREYFNIRISNLVASSDSYAVFVSNGPQAFNVLLNDSDFAGNSNLNILSVEDSISASKGSVTTDGNIVSYTPNAGAYGSDSFSYRLNDGYGNSVDGTVNVSIITPYTWTGSGGDTKWSNVNNWCGSFDGSGNCIGSSTAPTSSDLVVFSDYCGANCSVSIDVSINVDQILMTADYAGVLTQENGVTIRTNNFLVAGGRFSGGDSAINIGYDKCNYNTYPDYFGLLIQGGAEFTSTSGNLNTKENFVFDDSLGLPTFVHNNGSVVFRECNTWISQRIYIDQPIDFYNYKVNRRYGYPMIHQGPGFSIRGNLENNENNSTITNGYLGGGVRDIYLYGDYIVDQTWGSDTPANYDDVRLHFVGSSDQQVIINAGRVAQMPTVIINKPGGGNLTWSGGTIVLRGSLDVQSLTGAFDPQTSSLTWDMPVGQTLNPNGLEFYNFKIKTPNGSGGNSFSSSPVVRNDLTIDSWQGDLIANVDSNPISLYGDLRIVSGASPGLHRNSISGEIIMRGNGVQNITNDRDRDSHFNLTINKTGGSVFFSHDMDFLTQGKDINVVGSSVGTIDFNDRAISFDNLNYNSSSMTILNDTNMTGTINP